ncbi:MAG: 1-acyl-sn-glycerol-3-phosphate acyltransferase [Chloroflexi bacterium]|nr:1-acyl-sn-glycerol-3-phosphate acyltransferase [Chloroflexota bacterium]
MFYRFSNFLVRLLLRLLTRYKVSGLEFVPSTGPLVVAANHLSLIDPPMLGALLPRKATFMAKEELFKAPLVGWVVAAYGAFPVRRGEADRQALRAALKLLEQGQAIGMFPEGTRSKMARLQPAHAGAALVALRSGAPILPVGIVGTHKILTWPRILFRPEFELRFGPTFRLEQPTGMSGRNSLAECVGQMMRHVAALLPPENRGVYGEDRERIERTIIA